MFLNVIVKRKFSYQQCVKIEEFNQLNFDILNPSTILRLHKSSSYMVYIIKDIADYLSKQTTDGTFFVTIQYAISDNDALNKRVSVLHDYINNVTLDNYVIR